MPTENDWKVAGHPLFHVVRNPCDPTGDYSSPDYPLITTRRLPVGVHWRLDGFFVLPDDYLARSDSLGLAALRLNSKRLLTCDVRLSMETWRQFVAPIGNGHGGERRVKDRFAALRRAVGLDRARPIEITDMDYVEFFFSSASGQVCELFCHRPPCLVVIGRELRTR